VNGRYRTAQITVLQWPGPDDAAWCGWTLQIEQQAHGALVGPDVGRRAVCPGARPQNRFDVWFGLLADYDLAPIAREVCMWWWNTAVATDVLALQP